MIKDAWLPIGFSFPDGVHSGMTLHEGPGWQIVETREGGRALVVREELEARWTASGLISAGSFSPFSFGRGTFWCLVCDPGLAVAPVAECGSSGDRDETLAFAEAFRETRGIEKGVSLRDALYIEQIGRLLPTYTGDAWTDDKVFGCWLTGGVGVSVKSFARVRQLMDLMSADDLREVVEAAGFEVDESRWSEAIVEDQEEFDRGGDEDGPRQDVGERRKRRLELPGRPRLETFFNEHIVEVIQDRERYRALGIGFPSAVVLHGPPGCGKTFAVEQLVEFLGWPVFQIDSSSVASAYIHETSRKIAKVFDKAIRNAPSVLVIDEMEAFLADRDLGHGHHRVEEVAEFLRRIPDAVGRNVLIIAMTNRLDMIDPAIMRRGRFDHVIQVDYPGKEEVKSLIDKVLTDVPKEDDIDLESLAKKLAGRPLSDVAFVLREGARLAARAGRDKLDRESLSAALTSAPPRQSGFSRRIGFS
jgi:hypothetical protein